MDAADAFVLVLVHRLRAIGIRRDRSFADNQRMEEQSKEWCEKEEASNVHLLLEGKTLDRLSCAGHQKAK